MKRALAGAVAIVPLLASAAGAEPPFAVPWTSRPARFDARRDQLVVVSAGSPDERADRLEARRASARRRAEQSCRAALHRFVDEALSTMHSFPTLAARLHRAVDSGASVRGVRPLADGGVVMVMFVSGAELRDAATLEGAPWGR